MGTKSVKSAGVQLTQRGAAQGNILVDPRSGLPIDVILDPLGIRRLAVDALATINAGNIIVDVNLDSDDDEVAVEDPDTGAHIRVEPDGSINTNTSIDAKDGDNIAISGHKSPIFDEASCTITTPAYQQIYSYISNNDNTRISLIETSISTPATLRLKINGDIKKVVRTSPLERNARFFYSEHRPLPSGHILTIEAKVDRFLFDSYDSFTSLEGYLA